MQNLRPAVPNDGGLYAYMRDAFHPALGFIFGWTLLLVSQSGGMAAAAVTFASYFEPLTGWHASTAGVAVVAIATFTAVNALGVRTGTNTQNGFMLLKIAAIGAFAALGLFVAKSAGGAADAAVAPIGISAIGLAMVPVLFAYSGWQTSSFMMAELHEPQRTLPRGMIAGVAIVVALYLAVNLTCLHVLGIAGLASTTTPASQIALMAFGPLGLKIMAGIIAVSTLGFLSNQILTSPRVYFQMAADGTFFRQLASVNARTHAPVAAIIVQGLVAVIIALTGRYDQILNYVTCNDYIFFGLSAIALIVFRYRDAKSAAPQPFFRMPGHPVTTLIFLAAAWYIVGNTVLKSPVDTGVGIAILLSGLPVYAIFAARRRGRAIA